MKKRVRQIVSTPPPPPAYPSIFIAQHELHHLLEIRIWAGNTAPEKNKETDVRLYQR